MYYHYIEGQTPLDEDEKLGLIPSIITRADLNNWEQENIIEAHKWLMNQELLSKYEIFSEAFITNLHKRMFNYVWKWAGKFRQSNKNIGVEFYEIPLQLHQLLDDAKFWLQNNSYNSIELAVIFHHRLVKIHLFSNGNGRHARLIADAIITKYNGDDMRLSWGRKSDLSKPGEIRRRYIAALREADRGSYESILAFAVS